MTAHFNKEAILSGHLEYYCLVCEYLFKDKQEVAGHVQTEQHVKRFEMTDYVMGCSAEHVRKFKKCYYCEHCNEAFVTSFKLRIHLDYPTHKYLRESNQYFSTTSSLNLSWSGDDVLFSQILVKEAAWRGILDDGMCVICEEDVEDSWEKHKKNLSHVLRIEQKKFIVGKNTLVRKVDDLTYQCLICNDMTVEYEEHSNLLTHIVKFKKLLENQQPLELNRKTSSENNNSSSNHVIGIEKEVSKRVCTGAIAKKPQESAASVNNSAGNLPETAQKFAKANNITVDGNAAHCNTCSVHVPFNLKNMKEHVNGYMHKSLEREATKENADKSNSKEEDVQQAIDAKPYKTKQFHEFVEDLNQRVSLAEESRDFLINNEIYMEMLPLLMITKAGNQLVCQMCQKTLRLNSSEVGAHLHSKVTVDGVKKSHEGLLGIVPVVTDFKRELIREVRPNTFHCGYCNIIATDWDEINRHLNTKVHIRQKIEASWKAEAFKQHIDQRQEHSQRLLHALQVFSVMAQCFD